MSEKKEEELAEFEIVMPLCPRKRLHPKVICADVCSDCRHLVRLEILVKDDRYIEKISCKYKKDKESE